MILHVALASEWAAAVTAGDAYRRSNTGRSLDEGFIHCATAEQVAGVVARYYRGRRDLVVLSVATSRVGSPVRMEAADAEDGPFPHLYGPIPLAAVLSVAELR